MSDKKENNKNIQFAKEVSDLYWEILNIDKNIEYENYVLNEQELREEREINFANTMKSLLESLKEEAKIKLKQLNVSLEAAESIFYTVEEISLLETQYNYIMETFNERTLETFKDIEAFKDVKNVEDLKVIVEEKINRTYEELYEKIKVD